MGTKKVSWCGAGADRHTRRRMPFWVVAYAFVSVMIGANMPTMLYATYQERFGFPTVTLTAIFAVYVGGVAFSLVMFGRFSDLAGRRPALLCAVGFAAASTLAFVAAATGIAGGEVWLFVGRLLQGLAAGAISGAAVAALAELDPWGDGRRATMVGSAAFVWGVGLGTPVAGVLVQYAPAPQTLTYLVHLGLVAVALAGFFAFAVPETAPAALSDADTPVGVLVARGVRPQRLGVPKGIRVSFARASAAGFLIWAVAALYLTFGPSFVAGPLGVGNRAVVAVVVFGMLGTSAASQMLLERCSGRRSTGLGLVLVAAGLLLVTMALSTAALAPFVIGTLLAGLGHGLAWKGSLAAVGQISPAERRGEIVSLFYLISYLGVGGPVLGLGLAAGVIGIRVATIAFAAVIGIAALVVAISFFAVRHAAHVASASRESGK